MTDEHLRTPLYDLHLKHGAKMVPFAGYEMPVQYPLGVMKEHHHTRQKAGLFDASHMGQVVLRGKSYAQVAEAFENLIPMDVINLKEGRQRYGFLTNTDGGITDDIMFANCGDHVFLVVNAACVDTDLAYLRKNISANIHVKHLKNRSLLALQGPMAESVLAEHYPAICDMAFMDVNTIPLAGAECWVSRSGYTGEDGFEISVSNSHAITLAESLLAHPEVEAAGLGCRDSLRLEAGLCLHGNDINEQTTPLEANLLWAISPDRRADGKRAGNFPGDARILEEMRSPPIQSRVGLRPDGKIPVRPPGALFTETGVESGRVTSGSFGPSVGGPIAMGYVNRAFSAHGTRHHTTVRGKTITLTVVKLPFVAHNYYRRP